MLAFVVALAEEGKGILGAGRWSALPSHDALVLYQGEHQGQKVLLAVSGMGRERAQRTAREVLAHVLAHARPHALVSLGFSGGLAPGLGAGDLVLAKGLYVLEPAQATPTGVPVGPGLQPDGQLLSLAKGALTSRGIEYRLGNLLTTPMLITSREEKQRLGSLTDALVVDMESYWVGTVAREQGIPFLAARTVLDTAQENLPDFVEGIAGPGARGKALRTLAAHPGHLPALVRLARRMARARKSLAVFARALLEHDARDPVARAR
ncbi:MAG: hypothetical protein HY686_04500 [Chloroflexi bacterium]|nr:hypothetical protein [Chloroflexota bacterium]